MTAATITSDRMHSLAHTARSRSRVRGRAAWVWPWVLLAALVGLARLSYAALPVVPWPVHALLIGMLAGNRLASVWRRDLPVELPLLVGLILVGAQVHGALFATLSPLIVLPVLLAVALWTAALALVARLGWMPRRLAALLALGLSGFGISAITAAAAADPEANGETQVYATTVVLLTGALGLLLIVPLAALGVSLDALGVWAGASIANTAEAVTAADAISAQAGHTAAAIKLAVNALQGLPIVLYVLLLRSEARPSTPVRELRFKASRGRKSPESDSVTSLQGGSDGIGNQTTGAYTPGSPGIGIPGQALTVAARMIQHVPVFVFGFVLLAALGMLDVFTPAERASLHNITRWLFLAALVGVGFRTRPLALARLGWRPALIATALWLGISCLVLVCCCRLAA
ncbi:MAG: putative sulfate exporter family transporter [Planctomycetota bacterium]